MENTAFIQFGKASQGDSCLTVGVELQHTGKRTKGMARDATALRVKYEGRWLRVYSDGFQSFFIVHHGSPHDVTLAPIKTDHDKTGKLHRKIALSYWSVHGRYWRYAGTTEQWKTCRDARLSYACQHDPMGETEIRARFE